MKSRKTCVEMAAENRTHAPCKECKRRAVGCHSDCVDYGEYKKRLKQTQQDLTARNRHDIMSDHYKKENRERIERTHKK